MDSLLWALIGMIISFLSIYIFLSRKYDHSDLSELFSHKRKFSKKYHMAKEGLLILRKKNSIVKLFKELSDKDRKEVLQKIISINAK